MADCCVWTVMESYDSAWLPGKIGHVHSHLHPLQDTEIYQLAEYTPGMCVANTVEETE